MAVYTMVFTDGEMQAVLQSLAVSSNDIFVAEKNAHRALHGFAEVPVLYQKEKEAWKKLSDRFSGVLREATKK